MMRIIAFLIFILAAAAGLHWLADRPGTIVVEWQGYIAETSVFRAFIILAVAIGLAVLAWSALRALWSSPALIGRFLDRRRQQRGLGALSGGMIAIGAGDGPLALRYAGQARKALPNEPLTHLLRAQTAQLVGDRATSRRIFEAMLSTPDTEQLGLRGLFLEAEREGEWEAARQFAERALKRNPRLAWPVEALFDLQCRAEDWEGALSTLAIGQRYNLIDKPVAARRRAVLLTAQAQAAEDGAADKALELAREAHRLAPDLVPAAAIAGRVLAAQGNTPRAARVLLKTWRLSPHPDLAAAYAFARPGDSPRDRLHRMRHLARLTPHDSEGPIALAIAAIEAREWEEARAALEPLLESRLTQRVAALMARIEGEEHGDAGRVREWLARAVNAARDCAWTADGVVSDRWAPVSPVTGALDAFRWRVPVEAIDKPAGALLSAKLGALVGFAVGNEPALAHRSASTPTAAIPAHATVEPIETPPAPAHTGSNSTGPNSTGPNSTGPGDTGQSGTAPSGTAPSARDGRGANGTAPAGKPAVMHDAGAVPAASAATTKPRVVPAEPEDADDLKEHTRLAAQRAMAGSAAPTPENPAAANTLRAKKPAASPRQPKTVEPNIFVSPRAPDDPGLESDPNSRAAEAGLELEGSRSRVAKA
ncbi:MAG TPA: heme biosynthesis HemY N-terminal domain-containing protein [Hyphomicrobiaceae bacterium]